MLQKEGYIVFDIGTGNARVAIVGVTGEVYIIEREDIVYHPEALYSDSRYFSPDVLWKQIVKLAQTALEKTPNVKIIGITSTSQRQGIVLIDQEGHSFIGLPNIDNRGREWEKEFIQRDFIYEVTGRLPSALFSVLKLVGLEKKQKSLWDNIYAFTSISDWVTYKLSGVISYEPSQATETMLYDVRKHEWSDQMCELFGIPRTILPELKKAGSVLGNVLPSVAEELNLSVHVPVIVGGGDTQLAIESTFAKVNDFIVVSGTTTPICKVVDQYIVDQEKRVWTNAYTRENRWLVETNPGITGLNYQRLKKIFYPNETYQQIELEINELNNFQCVATLGSHLSEERNASKRGGFTFNVPIDHELTRAHFVAASLWEIACSIKWNYDILTSVAPCEQNYVWACGGGFQSKILAEYVASLLGKDLYIRKGYEDSSVVGAAVIANDTLGKQSKLSDTYEVIHPSKTLDSTKIYDEWKQAQRFFFNSHV